MDLDVGKTPPSAYVTNLRDPSSINELDVWIENLMECKQLSEENVQRLCEKVSSLCRFRRDQNGPHVPGG